MSITLVEVFTPQVISPTLPISGGTVKSDPIQIHDIDGLGPVNATVNTTQYGSLDGAYYNGSDIGQRNIVLTVGFNPDFVTYTIEQLRAILYKYFMPKNQVTLKFTSSNMAQVQISGYVESITPNIFSKDPELQVSIICPDPSFVATTATVITGSTIALPDGTPTVVNYQGSLPTGFMLEVVQASATAMSPGELRVINENPAETLFIINATVDATHLFRLGTVSGNKFVQTVTISTGAALSILGNQVDGSAWVQLAPGANKFRVATADPGQTWTLTYYEKYGGL